MRARYTGENEGCLQFLVLFMLLKLVLIIGTFIWGCFTIGFAHNPSVVTEPLGFFGGIFHGIIGVPAFLWSLVADRSVTIYEAHNTGLGYNFGYLLGAGMLFSSASSN